MASRRSSDNNTSRSTASSGQPKKAQWYTLAQWAAKRSSSTESSLSSTILKTSDKDADDTRGGPSEPESRRRRRSQTRRPRKGDEVSSILKPRERAEVNRQGEDSSSSVTPPPKKTPRHKRGQSPKTSPPSPATSTSDPRGPAVQGSFWSRPYLRGGPIGRVSSPTSTRGQSFWTASYPRDGSSRHAGPVDSPGPSGRQSFQAAPYLPDGSPWHWSPGSSTSFSRQGAARSAKKTAPQAEPEAHELSGARQPEASPQRSTARRSMQSVASTSFRPEEPRDNHATTSTGRMDDRTEAKPADNVGETVEQLGHSSASRTSGQLAPQQGAIKARRPLGLGVLREIRRLQSGVRTVIPRQAFARVVREIVQRDETGSRDLNMQRLALEALQEASEAVLVHILEGSNAIAQNAGRVTIMRRDMATVLRMIRSYGNLQLSLL